MASAPERTAMKVLEEEIEQLQKQISDLRTAETKTTSKAVALEAKKGSIPSWSCTLKQRRVLMGHFNKIYAMMWAATGHKLVSAAQDGKLIVWSALFNHKLYVVNLNSTWVMTCGFNPDGNSVCSGGLDNNCSIYHLGDLKTKQVCQLRGHEGYISSCRFFDKNSLVTSSGDGTCRLWDLTSFSSTATFHGHKSDVTAIAVDNQSKNTFVSGSGDQRAKLWDTRQANHVMTFHDYKADLNSMDFLQGGFSVLTGAEDGYCRLYDMRTYKEVANYSLPSTPSPVTSVAFSKSGQFFFAGYDDEKARVWNTMKPTTDGKDTSCQVLGGHRNRVSCIAVEPEHGKAVCTADWGNEWDAKLFVWSA